MKDFRRIAVSALIAVVAVNGAHVRARAVEKARINRAIDLLSQGQPIYYTGSHEGTDGSFE
jgi:hypothetical protein